jgi:hypothetical protein
LVGKQLKVGSSSLMLDPASGNLETEGKIIIGGVDVGETLSNILNDVATLQAGIPTNLGATLSAVLDDIVELKKLSYDDLKVKNETQVETVELPKGPLVVNGDREPLPNCDANTNLGQQVTVLWDDGDSSEICLCTVSPGGHGRWSAVASKTLTALTIGAGSSEAHGGMPRGRHHLMCDTSSLRDVIHIRLPVIFVGHPTVDQVPEVYVGGMSLDSQMTFETQGCVIKGAMSFRTVQHVKLALNNPNPKEGFKQALEISRGVLTAGNYQIDVPFPTDVLVQIAGLVDIVGVSENGEPVAVGLKFVVLDGGVLTTSGIYGFNGLSTERGGQAHIGISNPTPQTGFLQSLIFKDSILQPGKYQVDAPIDMTSTFYVQESGDVVLVGSASGAGSFKGVKWLIQNGRLIATSVEFGGRTGAITVMASELQRGYAKFTSCFFSKPDETGPMIRTLSTEPRRSWIANVHVEDSTFDGIAGRPVHVSTAGTMTLNNCVFQNFTEPLTAHAGWYGADIRTTPNGITNRHDAKLVINGGAISNFLDKFGTRGALYADLGQISISGVMFANNKPRNCAIDAEALGKIVGTGC